jgi:hypothetical protein
MLYTLVRWGHTCSTTLAHSEELGNSQVTTELGTHTTVFQEHNNVFCRLNPERKTVQNLGGQELIKWGAGGKAWTWRGNQLPPPLEGRTTLRVVVMSVLFTLLATYGFVLKSKLSTHPHCSTSHIHTYIHTPQLNDNLSCCLWPVLKPANVALRNCQRST